jgi:hypothetical protein
MFRVVPRVSPQRVAQGHGCRAVSMHRVAVRSAQTGGWSRVTHHAQRRPPRLPLMLNWSQPGRVFALADGRDRARVYEIALNEGQPARIFSGTWMGCSSSSSAGPVPPGTGAAAWAPLIEELSTTAGWAAGVSVGSQTHRPVRLEFGRSGLSRA